MANTASDHSLSSRSGGLLEAPGAGELLGEKYEVVQPIAEGGMAWVVAAKHVALDEIVALKVLKPEFAAQAEVVGRFAREAKAAMQIRSEHCVKIMDVGSDARRGPFIVMDYLEGSDLGVVLDELGRIPVRRAVDIALQACDALAHAHVLGIVHRDIKPENLFVTRQGDLDIVRVLDFGISKSTMTGKVFDTDLAVVQTQSLLGSPVYMSPEQMRGKDVDARADIWSLGALLYEALSGEVAFSGTSVTEVCSLVLETEPKALPPELCPPELAAVISKCLQKDPEARYANVGELALELMHFGPSRSRAWAERIVALLRSYGIALDDSVFKSVPPPSMSTPPSSNPAVSMERLIPRAPRAVNIQQGIATLPGSSRAPMAMPVGRDARNTGATSGSKSRRMQLGALILAIALLLGFGGWAIFGRAHTRVAAAAAMPDGPGAVVEAPSLRTPPVPEAPAAPIAPIALASSPGPAPPASASAVPRPNGRAGAKSGSAKASGSPVTRTVTPAPAAPAPASAPVATTTSPSRVKIVDDVPRSQIVD